MAKNKPALLKGVETVCRKTMEFEIGVDVSLSLKYKPDDNHKTNIDIFFFFVKCNLMTAAYNE